MSFLFGRKRRSVKKKGKPPARLIKMCKRYRIKVTRKVGRKKVYKSVTVLKRQLKKKIKKIKKSKKVKRNKKVKRSKKRTVRRKFRFGDAADFLQPSNYGYNQTVKQTPGVLSQSSQVITPANNDSRPPGFGVDPSSLPIYGVYRPFFTEQVPTQVGPNGLGFMGQPDGSLFPVGGPFSAYSSFGKRRKYRKTRR